MRISTKLILFLVTVVVAVMAAYALITVSRTQDRMQHEMVKMADHLGMALSVGVLHHLEEGDVAGVSSVLEMMARHADVMGVTVFDSRGRRVAGSGHIPGPPAEGEVASVSTDVPFLHNQHIMDATGTRVGDLQLAITGQSLLGHVVEARNYILFTILILTAVLSASIIYFSRAYLAGPLGRLTDGAEAIGRGELTHRIAVTGGGEVAVLAQAFNHMAESLQETNRQIVGEREYIRSIVDSVPEGIVVVDCEGRVRAWNRTMVARYGIDVEKTNGELLDEVMPSLSRTSFGEELRQVLIGAVQSVHQSTIRLPEEPSRVLSVTASPLRRQDDDMEGAVVILADVTERLRLEDRMQRSDKLAAVGQLAAGIAHEIGTPLNVISGNAEYLRAEHENVEELQTIVDEVTRISHLVQRLLSFARQEELQIQAVDVAAVIESVLSLTQHQMERKGVRVTVSVAADVPPVSADRGQLQQVVLNLVMNAWQAMPAGGDLTIAARADGLDESVIMEIEDTGRGIATEHLPRIFEPFYTTKDVGEGTGLGLAIVQRIVEDHGGSIEIRSPQGHGTTVELSLPASTVGVPVEANHV